MFRKSVLLLSFFMLIFLSACNKEIKIEVSKEYEAEMKEWNKKRISDLKKESGWLNLVGLYWLSDSSNTFGSSEKNDIVFPKKAEKFLGQFTKVDSNISFISNPNTKVTHNNKVVDKIKMLHDLTDNPTVLQSNSFRWFIIKRGNKFGIRLRDLDADLLKNFETIERFPLDEKWKIAGKFNAYNKPKKILVPTAIGTMLENYVPGKIVFYLDGKEYSLEPTKAEEGFFAVFADKTNGKETYGAGRFLYIDQPDSNNNVLVDFNKAYNPPCAFTRFATCPLPSKENRLNVEIKAGEKSYDKNH